MGRSSLGDPPVAGLLITGLPDPRVETEVADQLLHLTGRCRKGRTRCWLAHSRRCLHGWNQLRDKGL